MFVSEKEHKEKENIIFALEVMAGI